MSELRPFQSSTNILVIKINTYTTKSRKENGLTHASAMENAEGFENPKCLDVNKDKLAARANSYPRKFAAMESAISDAPKPCGVTVETTLSRYDFIV